MEKHFESFEIFVLVMMSDGDSKYPSKGVDCIKKSKIKTKLRFKSISYGVNSSTLKDLADDLGGTNENIILTN